MIEEADEEIMEDDGEMGEEAEAVRTLRLSITVDQGQELLRIDRFLMNRLEGATRNRIQQGLEQGHILVNNQQVKANYKVRPSDEILVFDQRKEEYGPLIPENIPLDIRYEDEDLMVVYKPAGMVVHPGSGNRSGTLINGLAYYLRIQQGEESALPRVGLVHRIDKNTTGLLVIGKTEESMAHLAAQFKKHTVHRRYTALVWGTPEDQEGTVRAHVGRHQRFRKMMAAYPEGDFGKEAVTHYRVIEDFHYVSLLELRLETGRTHQIRVHMKHIGHPLFNDAAYGGDSIRKGTVFTKYRQFVDNCFSLLPRHALHARELGFIHPRTGENMLFTTDLPEDMEKVLAKWRQYTKGMSPRLKGHLGGH